MYVMKPLATADTAAVDKLIAARMDFQIANHHRPRGEGLGLRDVVTGAGAGTGLHDAAAGTPSSAPDDGGTAIGMWEDEELVAAFVLQHAAPQQGWTIEEREEPTLLVAHAYSLPGQTLLGRLTALWLSDYAARQHKQPWVRCTVQEQALAWRLARSCGWRHVRDVHDIHGNFHLMQRPPERANRLEVVVTSVGVPDLRPDADHRLPA
ncbi:hypothetical protein ACFWUQ_09145 [Streptomyces sp. NPDC058662]|uniref:hypothetical protein n=1 Tax=Streptomyces sp. NPDC058662 TaxID=3346583 RepID=UPI0036481EF0